LTDTSSGASSTGAINNGNNGNNTINAAGRMGVSLAVVAGAVGVSAMLFL
jgi:hypothetical protein